MHGDLCIWVIYLTLCFISLIEVYSASARMSFGSGDYWRPILQHGSYMLMGIFIAWIVHLFPCNKFKMGFFFGMILSIFLLMIALVAGHEENGASRWIPIGVIHFQPSELAKLCLIGFTALIYSAMRDAKGVSPMGFKTVALAAIITMSLIVTENASTVAIIAVVLYGISFYAQVRSKILVVLFCIGIGGLGSAVAVAHAIPESTLTEMAKSKGPLHRVPPWVHRLTDKQERPADPAEYRAQDNPQKTYAKVAIATSNVIGRGPGNSRQRDFIPQAVSDFIYAIVIEELGIFGAVLVLGLYLLLMYRSIRIAMRCKSLFPAYLVMGLSLMIVVQAMMNMAVAVGAFPVTGQTLPLVSRGGTSLFVTSTYIGIILSVSYTAKRRPEYEKDGLQEA